MNRRKVELRREVGGYYLEVTGQPRIDLSPAVFNRLARQFVTEAHAIQKILEPPFVVRLHAQYNVDGDQQTPIFVDDWAFTASPLAEEFLARAQADVQQFKVRWPFRLWIPVVPELEYVPFNAVESVDQALADFRCCLSATFFEETGVDYWNKHLTKAERVAVWESLERSDCTPNLPFDPAEVESWAQGGASLSVESE